MAKNRMVEVLQVGAGCLVYSIAGVYGLSTLYLGFWIAMQVSPVLAWVGLLLFPALIGVAPIYALFAWGAWRPIVFVYGGYLVLFGIFGLWGYWGAKIEEKRVASQPLPQIE